MRTLILTLIAASAFAAGPTVDPQDLLKKSDRYRGGWTSYVTRVRISNFEKDKVDEEHLYEVSQKGTEKTFVEFLSPREKGRHLLMLGDDMWIYLPDTSRPVRITPLERLTGNTSNGDVARTSYAVDYDAVFERVEAVSGVECDVLKLTAKRKGSTYRQIEYWLRASDARPVKAEFFLASGKHVKSATFDEWQQIGGRTLLKKMTIADEIRKTSHSVMDYQSFTERELPDRLFHQGRAERF